MLTGACQAADISLGAYDERILAWLSGFGDSTCAVVAGIIRRASFQAATRTENNCLTPADLATLHGALADAAGLLEERAGQLCDGCTASPAEVCDEHAADLEQASAYRALSAKLGGES